MTRKGTRNDIRQVIDCQVIDCQVIECHVIECHAIERVGVFRYTLGVCLMSAVNYSTLTPAEWEQIEREEHDRVYEGMYPFGKSTLRFTPEDVLRWEDYCFKPGARPDRGHRTRRLFDLVGIDKLKGLKILDVGCGIGQYAVFFAQMGADVTAFDLSPVGVEIGQRMAQEAGVTAHCRFEVGNAAAMPYADETFDIVIYHEVLHHAIKYPGVREETLRVLKPGGRVVISETLRGNALLSLLRRISMHGEDAKGDVILVPEDLRGFAEGFSDYRMEPMSLFFMLKRALVSRMGNPIVRFVAHALKKTDDTLFFIAPSLKKYCGECVMVMWK